MWLGSDWGLACGRKSIGQVISSQDALLRTHIDLDRPNSVGGFYRPEVLAFHAHSRGEYLADINLHHCTGRDGEESNVGRYEGEQGATRMEYKSSMFRADTKYSGNHLALTAEIEKKLVEDKESSSRKGVLQLAEAVQTLFGVNASTVLPGINLTKIKHV
jgi:hypothetical protein